MDPKKNEPAKKPVPQPYTARDLAKDAGVPTAALVRRYLRAGKVTKPKEGWSWPNKAAAKDALDVVRRAHGAVGR